MSTSGTTQLFKLAIGLTSVVAVAGTIGQLYQVADAKASPQAAVLPAEPSAGADGSLRQGQNGTASGGSSARGRRRERQGDESEQEFDDGSGQSFQFAPPGNGFSAAPRTRTHRS